jgi:hypothetical protein
LLSNLVSSDWVCSASLFILNCIKSSPKIKQVQTILGANGQIAEELARELKTELWIVDSV